MFRKQPNWTLLGTKFPSAGTNPYGMGRNTLTARRVADMEDK
jgi:hypothetical protein